MNRLLIIFTVLLLTTPCHALDLFGKKKIDTLQQGINSKFDSVDANLSALSGNQLSMKNNLSALSGNYAELKLKLENTINAFNNAQLNLNAKFVGYDKSVDSSLKANRDLYQTVSKNNDVGIYYSIIGVMGFVMLLMAGLILYLLQSERIEDKQEKTMFREMVMKGEIKNDG